MQICQNLYLNKILAYYIFNIYYTFKCFLILVAQPSPPIKIPKSKNPPTKNGIQSLNGKRLSTMLLSHVESGKFAV